ncbi:MAG: SUMF1/EgtB/PvdO family nonheme iron enzyme [Proteobacteria bacterium]|nr:SUMF1/EgtB/PvdO family nonheme iron enzyme [Pseudomonadota bacterium]
MHGTTLRDLSRAYAAGALDRETYRRQRHDLLTRIEAGQLAVHAFQAPEPDQRTVFPYDDDEGDTTQEILTPLPSTRATSAPAKRRTPLYALGALLLIGAAAAYFFTHDAPPPVPTPPAGDSAPAASDPLSAFLNANQWDGARLAALATAWDALDDTARAAMRDAPSMRRLTDKAIEQILADNALITLGDTEEALASQQQVLDVMDHLGVEDARLRRAREAWRTASATFARERVAQAEQKALSAAPTTTPAPPTAPVDAPVTPIAAAPDSTPQPTPAAAVPANETPRSDAPAATPPPIASAPPVAPAPAKAARGACKASLAKTRRPYCQDSLSGLGKGPALVVLPAGQFEMGGETPQEQPRHAVTIERPFAIGLFEVSVGQFMQFCKATSSACPAQPWSDVTLPVVNVSWGAANAYVQWLGKMSGAEYRLPSEAQWEYAARAGSATPYPFGNEILPTHARYSFKGSVTSPLPAADRSVNRNDFKLYHMLGNVREWVADAWRDNYGGARADGDAASDGDGRRVARGGSYADRAAALRSAARVPLDGKGDQYTGFRVLRMIE